MTTPTRKSIVMMENTGRAHSLVGRAVRADGYFGHNDGVHTVQVIYSNFTGAFGLQGTLEIDPKESDWFFINLNSRSAIASPFIRYPFTPGAPTGPSGDTGTMAFTFTGNFVYLRAVLDRSYLIEPAPLEDTSGFGQIDRVLLSL